MKLTFTIELEYKYQESFPPWAEAAVWERAWGGMRVEFSWGWIDSSAENKTKIELMMSRVLREHCYNNTDVYAALNVPLMRSENKPTPAVLNR